MTTLSHAALASARSFLFVPANRPERYAKALASGADAVIIDLEDAVSPADKPDARVQLIDGFGLIAAADRARLVVRMNARGTSFHDDDLTVLQSLAAQGLGGVMVPKAETLGGLQQVARALGTRCALLPLIESVAGLDAADALASGPQVLRLAFGNLDFQADLGLACGPDEAELVPVRLAVVLAARRANLAPPIDGVTPGTQDMAQLQSDAARARRGGFGAKLCIHPAQVVGVNAEFTPTPSALDWAQRVLAAFEAAGGGVFSLDGRMVDAPVVRLAQRTLAQSRDKAPGV
jgi:citrate lyase subunit beta / citryl-CoA lyase